jgi:ADP-ribosylglycohydrolase
MLSNWADIYGCMRLSDPITYKGAYMLGAIIGDIVGSVYEFDNIKTKDFPLFREDSRITDDTVCTVAVADIILNHKDPVETLVYWCRKYPGMGYGDRFVKWFDLPWQEPYNSFGNGAAMRVSPVGLLAKTLDEALTNADRVTEITHNHPEGMKGARATVQAIFLARLGVAAHDIRSTITLNYGYDLSRSVNDIRDDYSFYESCQKTVPQALTCALEASGFEDAIRNAISIGGDSDTIGAIAGAVAEARFGIPQELRERAFTHLDLEMRAVIDSLYETVGH